jgi:hypothetical protein
MADSCEANFRNIMPNRLWTVLGLSLLLLAIIVAGGTVIIHADTTVCGPISIDAIWSSTGNDYIVTCDVQIMSGVTLTVQPGVVVKFDAGTSLKVDGTFDCPGVHIHLECNGASPQRLGADLFQSQ